MRPLHLCNQSGLMMVGAFIECFVVYRGKSLVNSLVCFNNLFSLGGFARFVMLTALYEVAAIRRLI